MCFSGPGFGIQAGVMGDVRSSVRRDRNDVDRLRASLADIREPVAKPVMVVVSGLPGSGKSYLARSLVAQVSLLPLERDAFRKVLFPRPTYDGAESARLFRACHSLIEEMLRRGVSILLDATNLIEDHRRCLYHIADLLEVKLILVYLKAPPGVVYKRLERRSLGLDPEDMSSADWQVYMKMSSTVEPIGRSHHVIDTSTDISPGLANVVGEIRRWTGTTD